MKLIVSYINIKLGRLFIKVVKKIWPEQFDNALAHEFDILPKGQFDFFPKGKFVFGPADRFLLIPKNRYRTELLPNQDKYTSAEMGVGWITEDNSVEGYDLLWGDTSNLSTFRAESNHIRDKLTIEIIDHIYTNIPEDGSVVDIGCGVGDLLKEIKCRKSKIRVSGVDFSSKAIEGARIALPAGDFKEFVIERLLPYESSQFDVVMCTDVLEHLLYPHIIVEELVRICKPGGIVVIVVPDGDVDTFLGHYWFWNQNTLTEFLSPWDTKVCRLPVSREFIAEISVPEDKVNHNE